MKPLLTALCVLVLSSTAHAAEWPDSYASGAATGVSTGPWWTSLGDVKLSVAVNRALDGNPDLRAAHALHTQSRALAMQQGSAILPSVSLNGRASLAPTESLGFGFGLPSDPSAPKTYTTGSGTLDAQWQIDLFGRNTASWHAAQSEAQATEADVEGRDRQVASLVAGAYLDVVAAKQRVAVLERQLKTNADLLTALQLKYQGGDAGSLDVLQQRQQVASSNANLPNARMALEMTEHRLAVLQGMQATASIDTALELPEPAQAPVVGRPQDLERNRPDVRAATKRLRAARDRRWASVGGFLPTLGASAQYGVQFNDRVDPSNQSFWNAGVSASMPLFNGGRNLGAARQARAAYVAAEASYESVQLNAVQQVESALVREQRQREYLDALRVQFTAADQAWTVAREQYLQGLTPFINVQNTLSRRQVAEISLIQGSRDLLSARIAVHEAVGGAWVANDSQEGGL